MLKTRNVAFLTWAERSTHRAPGARIATESGLLQRRNVHRSTAPYGRNNNLGTESTRLLQVDMACAVNVFKKSNVKTVMLLIGSALSAVAEYMKRLCVGATKALCVFCCTFTLTMGGHAHPDSSHPECPDDKPRFVHMGNQDGQCLSEEEDYQKALSADFEDVQQFLEGALTLASVVSLIGPVGLVIGVGVGVVAGAIWLGIELGQQTSEKYQKYCKNPMDE